MSNLFGSGSVTAAVRDAEQGLDWAAFDEQTTVRRSEPPTYDPQRYDEYLDWEGNTEHALLMQVTTAASDLANAVKAFLHMYDVDLSTNEDVDGLRRALETAQKAGF